MSTGGAPKNFNCVNILELFFLQRNTKSPLITAGAWTCPGGRTRKTMNEVKRSELVFLVGYGWSSTGTGKNKFKGGVKMKFCIQVSKKDLGKLQELENATGLGKSSIMSKLIDEVYASYKCSKISRNVDYMPITLITERFKKNIRR